MTENKRIEYCLTGRIEWPMESYITVGISSCILIINVFMQPVHQKIQTCFYCTVEQGEKRGSVKITLEMV